MSEPLYTVEMQAEQGSEQWLANRRTGIGGSDIAAVCGIKSFSTAGDVYLDKLGLMPVKESTRAMRRGNAMESFLKAEYELETGFRGYKPEVMFRSIRYPWLIANVDWFSAEELNRGAEFKGSEFPGLWGDAGSDDVPDDYWMQCQHYMIVTGRPVWDLYVGLPKYETRRYIIHADAEAQADIIRVSESFWKNHVLLRVPPAEAPSLDTVKSLYRRIEPVTVELDQTTGLLVERYKKLTEQETEAKTEKERVKAQLLNFMGEAGRATIPGYKFELKRSTVVKKPYEVKAQSYTDFRIVQAKG